MRSRKGRKARRKALLAAKEEQSQIDNQPQSNSKMTVTASSNARTSKKRESLHKSMLKFKRKQRMSLNARANDRIIRDNMFLKHLRPQETHGNIIRLGEEDLLALDNECILLEDTPEIIVIDDDEEIHKENSNETMNNQKDNTQNNSLRKENDKPGKIYVKFRTKEPRWSNDLSATHVQEDAVASESLSPNVETHSTECAPDSKDIANNDGRESSPQNTPVSVATNEAIQESDPEHETKHSLKNESQPEESILFFEDVTATTNVSRDEIPLYNVTSDTKDIFKQASGEDVVFVSSTPIVKQRKPRKKRNLDDSVIFVSEKPASIIGAEYLSFNTGKQLPLRVRQLQTSDGPPPRKKSKKSKCLPVTPENKLKNNADLFTASEKKKNAIYNSNTYNPHASDQSSPGKRMVILDGCNIAYGHMCGKGFSVKGIEIAIEYFEKMGHEVKAVVPQNRLKKSKSTEPELLEKLHRMGKVVLTPCKQLPGKSSISYDDRFILQLAVEFDAAIVSNDNYRDLLNENPAFKKIIECRVIGYTWCNDLFMLPKDPYGRNGPNLSVILNRV